MSVIVDFSILASDFVLGRALEETAGLEVELEQMVPTGETSIPYFWVSGEGREEFEDGLREEPGVREFETVDELETRTLYRAEWDEPVDTFIREMNAHDTVLLEASGDAESWVFQLRFPDSHVLSEFHTACRDAGLNLTVESLYNPVDPTISGSHRLTGPQQDLIERAYEEGYFEVPRQITLAELADELDISDQSVNERLRRGLSTLIETTLESETPERR